MEEAQQKLDEAEHSGRGSGGSLGHLRRALSGLASPAFMEALCLTFIGGAPSLMSCMQVVDRDRHALHAVPGCPASIKALCLSCTRDDAWAAQMC